MIVSKIKEWSILPVIAFIAYSFITFLFNMVQLILYILIAPFSSSVFWKLNYFLIRGFYQQFFFLTDWWSGCRMKIYSDPEIQRKIMERKFDERALIVLNHHYELDFLFMWMLADRAGQWNCRIYSQDQLKFVPSNFTTLKNRFKEIMDMSDSPLWLFVIPEGTKFSQEGLKESQEFAKNRGLPVLDHQIIPRTTKGFSFATSNLNREKFSCVYDITLVCGKGESAPVDMVSLYKGRGTDVNVFMRKIPLNSVPVGEKESREWLMKLFKEKDIIKKSYKDNDWSKLKEVGGFSASGCITPQCSRRSLIFPFILFSSVIGVLAYYVIMLGEVAIQVACVVLGVSWVGFTLMI